MVTPQEMKRLTESTDRRTLTLYFNTRPDQPRSAYVARFRTLLRNVESTVPVALIGRTCDRVAGEAERLRGVPVIADLGKPDGPGSAVEAAVAAMGGLDLLVVNSGGPPGGTFEAVGEAEWEQAIAGTLQSALRLIRAAQPHLREGRDPAILVVLSSSVREPIPALITSNVLRPGLAGLIKSLTAEIAPIRINGVAPGRIATERIAWLDGKRAETAGVTVDEIERRTRASIPLGRYGEPAGRGSPCGFKSAGGNSAVNGRNIQV